MPSLPAEVTGGSIDIPVRCAPTGAGRFTGTLVIATNAAGSKLIEVPMSCESGALLAATPAVVDFGGVPTGQTKTRIIGLKNVGIESVTILSALTNGTGFSGSGLSEPIVLAPNESFALDAVFSPQQAGVSVGTLTIQPSGVPPTIVPLTGVTGPSVSVNVPNDPIDFGVQGVGSTTELPVIVTNTGTSAASFGGASVSAAPFSVEGVPDIGPIAPGEQVVFFVRFSPPVIGNYGATLSVVTDGQTTEVSVTGKTGGALVVAPETLDFGNVPLGQAAELPLGVSNISPDTSVEVRVLQGGDIAAFTLIGLSDGDTLPANASLTGVKIQFNPTTERDYQSVFTFTTNDGVEGQAYTLIATGRSGAQLSLLHPRAAFHAFENVPIGTSRSLPLRIAAPGGSAASILGYTLDGDGTSEFQFSLSGLGSVPVTLQSEAVLDLDVTCSPQQAGVHTATLNLATDMPSMPVIPVKLWCSTPASITAAPQRVEFDAVDLLTPTDKTVTFTNVGSAPVLLTSAAVSTTTPAALELTNPLLGNTVVEVGASHDFNVRLTPDIAGDFEGELVVSSTDAVSPTLSIPITGFSGPRVQASTEAVLFCSADTKTISLTNTGTSTAAVESVELTSSDASLQVTVVDGSGQPLTGPYFLEPDDSIELQVAWSGVLSGADEAAGNITVVSDDPRGNRTIALVAGRGWVVPNEFNGVADLGEPGAPAFPGATGLGLAGAELCTGGGIYGSHIDQALYAARPSALGAATPSTVWGLDGVIDLQQVRSSRPDITAALDDLGADISVFDGGDLIAVGAPATGHWLLVRPNGDLASSHPSGGVLSLSKALSARAIAGGLDRRDTGGFVSVDRLTRAVIGIQSNSLLDTDFGASGVITLGNVFPEFDVSGTVGESVQTLANGSVAITDGATAQIFIVRPDGTPDTTLGASNSGVLTLNAGFQPKVTSIGGIVRFGAGFTAVEPARNSLLFIGAGGGPIPGALGGTTDNGRLRIAGNSGAFPAAGRLAPIIYQTTEDAVASPANAGKWMLFDAGFNDILVLDENGSGFESGLPELQADCPVNIQQGQTGAIQLTNTGQATLSLTDAEVSSDDLACVGCAGVAIVPGDSTSINLQWTVPEGAQGCFTEQLTLIHDGVNNPTFCPVQLGTNAAFQVVPGSDTAYQYVFPPVSSGGAVTRDLVIRNAGCTPFTLQSLVLSGDSVFTVPPVPVDGVELAFGDVYVASVTCAPDAGGQYDGTLIFGATSNVTTQPLQLFCTSGPYLDRSATSLDWGSQALGTGGSRTLTLTSSGGAPVNLIAVEPDGAFLNIENQAGTPEGTFELLTIPSVASPLAVGLSFDLTIIFTPPDHGEYAAELVIGANSFDAVSEEVRIPLTGTSTAEAVFIPASLDFGIVGVGAEACQAVDIKNNGAVNLSIQLQQASLEGTAFRFEGNPVVPNILPFNANTKTVELCCEPDAAGVFTTSLDIALDGAASELTQYDLTCRGESCFTREDSTGLDFGEVRWDDSSTYTIALTADIGSQALDVEVSGAGVEQVIIGSPVLIDGAVEIAVTFDPSGDFVPVDAVLTVTSELCSSELTIPITGNVIPPEAAAVDGDAEADSADSVDSSDDSVDGTDATAAVDEADGVGDTSDGADGIDSSDVVEASGVDDGCGCDMTPKQKPFPTGPATALVLVSLLIIRARIRE
ncbi:MAG: choice-of-anchor D domain-containing protein [Myxococcota bacterium]|nr:choice-of-anchor D domain-containing protein [Myxococcota bacterium]